ncbi:MAG: hypothetical protein AB1717_05960 [Pseudomonadota bacterium]
MNAARPQGRAFRQFPPYSNQARQRLHPSQAGRTPAHQTLFIHAGRNAWDYKSDPCAFVLSPCDQDPAAHDWSVCKLATPPVLIVDRGATDDHLERVALACLRDGAQRVLVLQPPAPSTLFVGNEVQHGVI